MIDAVDLRFVVVAMQQSIERLCRLQIAPERLLDDDACPADRPVQSHLAKADDRIGEGAGRKRQVECAVAGQLELPLQLVDATGDILVIPRAPLIDSLIEKIFAAPDLGILPADQPRLLESIDSHLTELLIAEVATTRHAQNHSAAAHRALRHQVVQRRQQLAAH